MSIQRAESAVQALSLILGPLPFSENPAFFLLHDPPTAGEISRRLRHPSSGAGADDLCRWLYDTFQSTDPDLQLAVLRFVPTIAAVYLPRAASRHPHAGFEAVLLAIYSHETVSRCGDPLTIAIPNLENPSLYHEVKSPTNNEDPTVAIVSPVLEPHGTVRSTRRAGIVGVAFNLYYSRISQMPTSSKLEFCNFCIACVGTDRKGEDHEECGGGGCIIPLPWELFQPILRIVGHCLQGPSDCAELRAAALAAVRCLHSRAMHDMSPQAVLATRSLLRLGSMAPDTSVWEQIGFSVSNDSLESESGRISV